MSNYFNPFGANQIQSTNSSGHVITLTGNLQMYWQNALQSPEITIYSINIIESDGAYDITLDDAQNVAAYTNFLFINASSFTITLRNFAGDEILQIAPNLAYFIYLTEVPTIPPSGGFYDFVQYGVGSASPAGFAAALAGAGLINQSSKLNLNIARTNVSGAYTILPTDWAKGLVWTGGTDTIMLPPVNSVTNGFNFFIANQSTVGGQVTLVTSDGALIDGQSSLTLAIQQSCMIIGNQVNWVTFGLGKDLFFFIAVNPIDVSSSTNITVSALDAAKQIQNIVGTPIGNTTITFPSLNQVYYINNNASPSIYDVSVKMTGGATTTIVPNGERLIFECDGVDLLDTPSILNPNEISLLNGSASDPSLNFVNSTNTGLYLVSPATPSMGVTIGGTNRLTIDPTNLTSTINYVAPLGSASAPTYSFSADSNTGIYSPGANQVAIATNGANRVTIDGSVVTSANLFLAPIGSSSNPSYSFSGGGNNGNGMYLHAPAALGLAANGTNVVIATDANVSLSVPLVASNGTVADPSVAFSGDKTSGLYLVSSGKVGVAIGGASTVATFTVSGVNTLAVLNDDGMAASPSYTFGTDLNTGMFRSGSDQIGFSAGGTNSVTIDASGIHPINIKTGASVLSAGGTKAVATTAAITGTSVIMLTALSHTVNSGTLAVTNVTTGVGFDVESSNTLDDNSFAWFLYNP